MKISSWTHATSTLNYFWYFAVLGFSTSSCPAALNTHHSTSVVCLTTARPLDCRFFKIRVPGAMSDFPADSVATWWCTMAWLSKCKDLPKLQAGWKPKVESAMCNLCQNPSKISGVRHLGAGAPLRGGKLWVLLPQGNEVAPRWTPGHHGYSVVCRVVWKLRPGWLQPSTTGVDLTAVAGWGVLLGTCLAYLSHDSSVMIVMILFFLSICALFWCVTWMCYYVIYGLLATYDFHLCSREFRWFILPNNERNDHTRTLRWFSLCIIYVYIERERETEQPQKHIKVNSYKNGCKFQTSIWLYNTHAWYIYIYIYVAK